MNIWLRFKVFFGYNIANELDKYPQQEWLDFYRKLNTWELPDKLMYLKPKWYDDAPSREKVDKFLELFKPFMAKIKSRFSEKEINRAWNNDMTDSEFDYWWNVRKPEFEREMNIR